MLNVLGEPGVTTDSVRQRFSGELVGRLATALCAAYPEPLSQDELGHVLWDREAPPTWRSALRVHISRLRSLLRTDPTGPELRSTPTGYVLVGDENHFDFVVFRDLVARSTIAATVTQRHELLSTALGLWKGSAVASDHPMLCSFLDRLEKERRAAQGDRYRSLIELGCHGEVIGELLNVEAEDRVRDRFVEPLVGALILSDRRAEAREILNEATELLMASGRETGAGLQALQRQLLVKEFELSSEWRSANLSATAERQQEPFVGRDAVIGDVRRLIADGPRWCLIEGEGGIGKSRLVGELCRSIAIESVPILFGSCVEYSPPGQLFNDLIASAAPGMSFAGIDPVESMWLCIDSLGENPPLLVIEDIHNIDLLSSKQLRRFLFQRRSDSLSVAITTRPGPYPPFIRELIVDLLVSARTHHVVLECFTRETIDEWLAFTYAGRMSRRWELAGNIHRLSGGLPLLVELLFRSGDIELGLNPESLDGRFGPLVAALGRSLTEDQREIIAVGALCGLEFSTAVAAEVVGCSAAQLFDAVDTAYRLGVTLKRSGQLVSFRHDLIRQAIVSEQSELWRSRTHRRIAEVMVMRELDEGSLCLHLASSLTDAQGADEVDDVLRRVAQLQEASRWDTSTTALEICQQNLATQPWLFTRRSRFELFRLLGKSYEGSHDAARARECFRRAVEEANGEVELISTISIESAGGSLPFDGDEERLAWLRLSLSSNYLTARKRLTLLAEFVKLQAMVGLTEEVLEAHEEIVRLVAQFEDNEAVAIATYGRSVVLLLGSEARGRLIVSRAVDRSDTRLRSEVVLTSLLVEMVSVLELGQLATAWTLHQQMEAHTEQSQRPGEQWLARVVKSVLLDWEGREREATLEADSARQLAERHEVRNGIDVWTVFTLSRVLRDDLWLQVPVGGNENGGSPTERGFGSAIALVARSRRRLFDGFPEATRALVARLDEEPKFLGWLGVVTLTAEAHCNGPGESTEELLALLLPYSGTMVINGIAPAAVFGPVDFYLGSLERQRHHFDAAHDYAVRALTFAKSSGLVRWVDRLAGLVEQCETDMSH